MSTRKALSPPTASTTQESLINPRIIHLNHSKDLSWSVHSGSVVWQSEASWSSKKPPGEGAHPMEERGFPQCSGARRHLYYIYIYEGARIISGDHRRHQVVSLSIDSRVVSLVIDSQIHVPFFRKKQFKNIVKNRFPEARRSPETPRESRRHPHLHTRSCHE